MNYRNRLWVGMMMLAASQLTQAEEFEQHGAHVHGAATMNLALEEGKLVVELESPAMNLVGFEHAPATDEERQQVEKAAALLKKGEELFGLTPAAGCKLLSAEVDGDVFEHDEDGGKHEEADHDEHGHSDDAHQEHSDDKNDHDHHEDGHSDIDASYIFECGDADKLTSVDVLLFKHFPALNDLDVQVIGPKGQTAMELNPEKHQINL
ncbi:ABC-type metal ion transport system, periplasmic component/surface adhesin [Hahella chejuensis KCTC 2396]|uniref:ABC-type metal ion transport system, periplasmic component/surface adhesin n=1 Tax=Hahella chejuensis (strain KCTC 2396) TaxID=349521 RepID=Q2SP67_HAHCH|nr:DUF2796 domain-containing protein [Hahella chejuensis]ABC27557.1 ABC-type metal ion transport system, periplasmic component/surface adhesin [Hahella chejuensis KCTC 2396]